MYRERRWMWSEHDSTPLHECWPIDRPIAGVVVWGGTSSGRHADLRHEVQSKIHSLANLAAARATCQPAAAARRSQARRGAHPTQNAVVLRPDARF